MAREQRRLAAILAADVVGYSRLMGHDESGTVARLRRARTERLEPLLARRGGRVVKLTGDGALIGFAPPWSIAPDYVERGLAGILGYHEPEQGRRGLTFLRINAGLENPSAAEALR